jgi:hypothetical protein
MNKYLDILTLMKERTERQIGAFTSTANALHVYEGPGTDKELTREMQYAWEQQRVDLDYLISREDAHDSGQAGACCTGLTLVR